MKSTKWIMGGLTAALVIVIGGFMLTQLPVGDTTTASGSSPGPSASPKVAPTAPQSDPEPSAGPTDPANPADPPVAGKRYSTEVLPPGDALNGLPASKVLPYPVSAPLPKSASAVGGLATGYPADVLPAAPGSKIRDSSVASQESHLQVSLTAKTSADVNDVVAFYRTTLAQYGMYDAPSPALNGSTAVSFTRDGNSVTVSVTPGKSGTTYSLFGTFTVKG